MKTLKLLAFFMAFALCSISCKDDVLPKPNAQLNLEYPTATYKDFQNNCKYSCSINTLAKIENKENCSFSLHYPKMKATVFLTYQPVNQNLKKLLQETQKLTYEHVIKIYWFRKDTFIRFIHYR